MENITEDDVLFLQGKYAFQKANEGSIRLKAFVEKDMKRYVSSSKKGKTHIVAATYADLKEYGRVLYKASPSHDYWTECTHKEACEKIRKRFTQGAQKRKSHEYKMCNLNKCPAPSVTSPRKKPNDRPYSLPVRRSSRKISKLNCTSLLVEKKKNTNKRSSSSQPVQKLPQNKMSKCSNPIVEGVLCAKQVASVDVYESQEVVESVQELDADGDPTKISQVMPRSSIEEEDTSSSDESEQSLSSSLSCSNNNETVQPIIKDGELV